MKNVASLNEQVLSDPEKAIDFFIAFCKAKRKKKKLSENEIPFSFPVDQKILSLKPTEKEVKRSDDIIKTLYDFAKKQSIKLPSYKSFREEALVLALKEEIQLFEISRRVHGTTGSSLVHLGISLTNEIFDQMGIDVISEAFARQMLLIYLNTTKEPINHLTHEIPSPDPFKVNAQYFDRRYYYKEKGKFIPFEAETSPDRFADYYLQSGGDVLHCKTNKKQDVVEVTIYQLATIEDHKLVTSIGTIEETLYIPRREVGLFLSGMHKPMEEDANVDLSSGEEGISISAYMEAFQRYASNDKFELTRHCIAHFYRMISGGFPSWTEEQVELTTGFLCVQLGVLQLKKTHSEK